MLEDKVNYSITKGLIFMLSGLSGDTKKEVWAKLAEATQVCVERIKKKNMRESWRWFVYGDTEIKMKVKVHRNGGSVYNYRTKQQETVPVYYNAHIQLDKTGSETFTSQQVADFLIEEVLLGEVFGDDDATIENDEREGANANNEV